MGKASEGDLTPDRVVALEIESVLFFISRINYWSNFNDYQLRNSQNGPDKRRNMGSAGIMPRSSCDK
jgi:hypothetical protein